MEKIIIPNVTLMSENDPVSIADQVSDKTEKMVIKNGVVTKNDGKGGVDLSKLPPNY